MYSTHRSLTPVHTILLRNDDLCSIGYLKATIAHIRVTLGRLMVTLGHLRVTLGHLTLGHLWVTLDNFFYKQS